MEFSFLYFLHLRRVSNFFKKSIDLKKYFQTV